MALWVCVSVMSGRSNVVSQEVHGPFDDIDEMTDVIDACDDDADEDGHRTVPFAFELCSDDVPELVQLKEV